MRKLVDFFIMALGYYFVCDVVIYRSEIYGGENAIIVIGLIMSASYLTHMYMELLMYKIKMKKLKKIRISTKKETKKEEKKAEDTATKTA